MRHSRIFAGLILVVAAAVILTVVVGGDPIRSAGSNRLPSNDEASPSGAMSENHVISKLAEDVDRSQPTGPDLQSPSVEQARVEDDIVSSGCVDAAAELEQLRDDAEQKIPSIYSLMFNHLELTQSEKQDLSSLLVESSVAGTYTACKEGTEIDPQNRSDMIEAIVGPAKLARYLSLEQHRYEYGEINFVDCVLNNNGSALTDTQRNSLFEIIVEIAAREEKLPGADAERNSLEYLEYHLAELNERTRLFLERIASELSPKQVEYLFDEYQRISYRQADSLERQKRARIDPTHEPLPWYYPARSCEPRK